MKNKLYKNREWLLDQYWKRHKSIYKIAKICNCCPQLIHHYMIKLDISRRSTGDARLNPNNKKLYNNKQWLINKYCNEKLSQCEIANICNCSRNIIIRYMRQYNIKSRSINEGNHLIRKNNCNLSQKALQFISGEMLGDMHIGKPNDYSSKIGYSSKYLEYLKYISGKLSGFGIMQSGAINEILLHSQKRIYSVFSYLSLSYAELLDLHKKWYIPYIQGVHGNEKRRKWFKIVPRDIKLTPIVCRQWYIGDGSLAGREKAKHLIRMCTNGFSINDVNFLVNKLNEMGIRIHKTALLKFN